jgi:hypothetical protein
MIVKDWPGQTVKCGPQYHCGYIYIKAPESIREWMGTVVSEINRNEGYLNLDWNLIYDKVGIAFQWEKGTFSITGEPSGKIC